MESVSQLISCILL